MSTTPGPTGTCTHTHHLPTTDSKEERLGCLFGRGLASNGSHSPSQSTKAEAAEKADNTAKTDS